MDPPLSPTLIPSRCNCVVPRGRESVSHSRTKGSNNGDLNNTGTERERERDGGLLPAWVKLLSPPCSFCACEISYVCYRDALSTKLLETEDASETRGKSLVRSARYLARAADFESLYRDNIDPRGPSKRRSDYRQISAKISAGGNLENADGAQSREASVVVLQKNHENTDIWIKTNDTKLPRNMFNRKMIPSNSFSAVLLAIQDQ